MKTPSGVIRTLVAYVLSFGAKIMQDEQALYNHWVRVSDWRKLDCSVYGVDTYVVTQSEKGGSLVPRFADGALTLWLTERCSLPEHVEQLTRLQNAKAGYVSIL